MEEKLELSTECLVRAFSSRVDCAHPLRGPVAVLSIIEAPKELGECSGHIIKALFGHRPVIAPAVKTGSWDLDTSPLLDGRAVQQPINQYLVRPWIRDCRELNTRSCEGKRKKPLLHNIGVICCRTNDIVPWIGNDICFALS